MPLCGWLQGTLPPSWLAFRAVSWETHSHLALAERTGKWEGHCRVWLPSSHSLRFLGPWLTPSQREEAPYVGGSLDPRAGTPWRTQGREAGGWGCPLPYCPQGLQPRPGLKGSLRSVRNPCLSIWKEESHVVGMRPTDVLPPPPRPSRPMLQPRASVTWLHPLPYPVLPSREEDPTMPTWGHQLQSMQAQDLLYCLGGTEYGAACIGACTQGQTCHAVCPLFPAGQRAQSLSHFPHPHPSSSPPPMMATTSPSPTC